MLFFYDFTELMLQKCNFTGPIYAYCIKPLPANVENMVSSE